VLNVVAIGDSIMWGQGNREEAKFTSRVLDWLRARGQPAELASFAHSGAIAARTPRDGGPALWGEVPDSTPSVTWQLAAVPNPDTVDVVLLNGGINDVSPFHIAVANPFDPGGLATLRRATTNIFNGAVRELIEGAAQRFRNAKVVVLGYYPIISDDSSGPELVRLMRHIHEHTGLPSAVDWAIERLADDAIELAIAAEKRAMVEQCAAFHAITDEILRTLIRDLAGGVVGPRIGYAAPAFTSANAFAARDSWLWMGSDDPLHDERLRRFATEGAVSAWPVYTPLASMCHPNDAGCAAYAAAITGALKGLGF
jgi:lysophospholipase L1-like esterase